MTDETHPDLPGLTRAASDIISVRRVFGEPYAHGDTLVVPVAKVLGWHGVAGAHADARVGIRGGHGGAGGPGSAGPGEDGGASADAATPDGAGGPAGHGGDGGPGVDAGGPATDATADTGHGAHAGAPAPGDGPWAQSGPGAPTGAAGGAGGGPGGPGGGPGGPGAPVAWAGPGGGWPHGPGRGGWHGGPGHGGRLPFLRGPLWPFGAGRPGGRGVGAADAGGYATRVKPIGVFVIDDDGAQWQPALDLNRIILGGQVVGAVAAVAFAWALRRRRH